MRKNIGIWPMLIALGASQGAVAQGFPNFGGLLGNGGGGGNSLVTGLINGLMGQILQSLTTGEQQQRQQALQEAARSPSGSTTGWATPESNNSQRASTSYKPAPVKKATYVNKGQVTDASGKKCSRVLETITMPDGQKGTSEQLVCAS
jgi:hypothetical protein